jgi:hypothetical protein
MLLAMKMEEPRKVSLQKLEETRERNLPYSFQKGMQSG